jgi:hypothetical protein
MDNEYAERKSAAEHVPAGLTRESVMLNPGIGVADAGALAGLIS